MSRASTDQKLDRILQRLGLYEERLARLEHAVQQPPAATISKTKQPGPAQVPPILSVLRQWFVRPPLALQGLGLAITIVGFVSAYTALRYDISVATYASLDPSEPEASRFLITNQSAFSIYNVFYSCGMIKAIGDRGPIPFVVGAVPFPVPELRAHSSLSLRCPAPLTTGLHIQDGALQEIDVFYRPKFWPWQKQGAQLFLLIHDKQGNAIWLPQGSASLQDAERMQFHP